MHTGNYHHDDIYRNVTSRLVWMYVMQSTTVLNYKRRRKGDLVSDFSFDHRRFASIIIFLQLRFDFFRGFLIVCLEKRKTREETQFDADLSIMASSMSCPLHPTKEIVLSRLASPTNQTISL